MRPVTRMSRRSVGGFAAVLIGFGVWVVPAEGASPQTVVDGKVPATAPVLRAGILARVPGWSFGQVAIADVDRDGRRDVIAMDTARQGVVVARSTGGGRFTLRRHPNVFAFTPQKQLAVGDIDGDSRPDLVTTGSDIRSQTPAAQVQIAYGTRHGFSRSRVTRLTGGEAAVTLALADVNADGRTDVLAGINYQEGHRAFHGDGVLMLRARPGRRLARPVRPTALRGGVDRGAGLPQLLAGDLDRDGRLDVVFRGALLRGLKDGHFGAPTALGPRTRDVEAASVRRLLVRRSGRTDVLAASRVLPHNATERLGVVARGVRPARRPTITRLQRVSDDLTSSIDRGQVLAGHLRSGAGYDVVLAGRDLIWMASTTDGTRFGAAVPTIVPPTDGDGRAIAVGDLTGDDRDEIVSGDADGRLVLLRAMRRRPLARPVLPRSAPLLAAGVVYPTVSCRAGAGACIGRLRLADGGYRALRLAPGASVRAPVQVRPLAPAAAQLLLRWESPLIGAQAPLRLTPPAPGDIAAACAPPPGTRALARTPGHVLVRDRDFVTGLPDRTIAVCTEATGERTPFGVEEEPEVLAPPIAAFGPFVATLRDVCPGGFEGCIAGLSVVTIPEQTTVTAFDVGDGVEALAVGAEGALAWIQCPYAGEFDPTCDGGPYSVLRLDARGRRRVGAGRRIDPRSLKTTTDGHGFTWRDAERNHRSTFSGPPSMRG